MNTRHPLCGVVFLCATFGGCDQDSKDLGNSRAPIGTDGGAPPILAAGGRHLVGSSGQASGGAGAYAADGACTAELAARAECYNWRGYAENYQFRSGSDRVRITKFNASGTWEIQFGDVTLPALDANRGYPQPFDSDVELLEGFAYPLDDVTESGTTRITFSFDPRRFWADWCAIQTPIAFASGYACAPQGGYTSDATSTNCWLGSNPAEALDCTKTILCMADYGVCTCDAAQCFVRPSACVVRADLREMGPDLDGSLILKCPADVSTPPATDLPITVHLTGNLN